jgi:hypothetical protein
MLSFGIKPRFRRISKKTTFAEFKKVFMGLVYLVCV